MKKYLCIENIGHAESESFALYGASTKRDDDTKVGMFGSGAKLGIAWLLRNDIAFRIFSGADEIIVDTEQVIFRGQGFRAVRVNGIRTGLTTDAGPQWKPWEVFREFYFNASDEGEHQVFESDAPTPRDGFTRIYIALVGEFGAAWRTIDQHFTMFREPIWESNEVAVNGHVSAIYKSRGGGKDDHIGALYRRGVMVDESLHGWMLPLKFDFDLTHCGIDESRHADNSTGNDIEWWRLLLACDHPDVIADALSKLMMGHIPEAFVGMYQRGTVDIADAWLAVFERHTIYTQGEAYLLTERDAPRLCVSESFLTLLQLGNIKHRRPVNIDKKGQIYEIIENPTSEQTGAIAYTMHRIAAAGILVPASIDIRIGRITDPRLGNLLGHADIENARVVITERGLSRGSDDLCRTLIEEVTHIVSGATDESRAMQEALLDVIITLISANEGK